jgi:CheY-like chemotaxis protein
LRFNTRRLADSNNDSINEKDLDSNITTHLSSHTSPVSSNSSSGRVISIDTITLDKHSRLTLTKKVKDVFPIQPGDRIAVYQNVGKINNELIFEVQRRNRIVDTWAVKRNTIGVSTTAHRNTIESNPIQDDGSHLDYDKNQRYSNIMLIDDEPDLLVAFKSILSMEGYNVEAFSNSQEALKRFLEVKMNNNNKPSTTSNYYYDLIITDIRMPDLNGIQLYQILKTLCANVDTLYICS